MFLIAAALLFAVFAANVMLGAAGMGNMLGDVSEMLVLFAASITFVVAILKKEARRNAARR